MSLLFVNLRRIQVCKIGLVQSWVTLPEWVADRLGFAELSLFAKIGRSKPSIPVQRGRAVHRPYCYPKRTIFEPCRKIARFLFANLPSLQPCPAVAALVGISRAPTSLV